MHLIEFFESTLTGGVKARRKGNIAVVDELWVPPEVRGEGHGTRLYQQWERNLPDDISVVRLMPVDYGAGDPTEFWRKMGFRFVSDKWMEKRLGESVTEAYPMQVYGHQRSRFEMGECDLYALALHLKFGFKIQGLWKWSIHGDELVHYWAVSPDGRMFDHTGELTNDSIKKRWGQGKVQDATADDIERTYDECFGGVPKETVDAIAREFAFDHPDVLRSLNGSVMESKGLWEHLKTVFPNVPDYVMKDLVYPAVRDSMRHGTADYRRYHYKEAIGHFKKHLGHLKWKQEVLDVTPDIFNTETRQRLAQRAGGKTPEFGVPRDVERHETQKKLIAQGPRAEPIIVVDDYDGFDLWEGWHRTIQSIAKWPQGYKQVAWVGYQ